MAFSLSAAPNGQTVNLVAGLARDATYVTVGLAILGYQRLKVRQRELERSWRA